MIQSVPSTSLPVTGVSPDKGSARFPVRGYGLVPGGYRVPGPFLSVPEIDTRDSGVGSSLGSGRFGVVILKDLKVLVCHGFWLAVEILVQVFDGFCLLSHFPITFSVGDTNWAYLRLFLYILVTF